MIERFLRIRLAIVVSGHQASKSIQDLNIPLAALALVVLCATSCREQEARNIAVQPYDALDSDESIRATLERIFPDEPIPVYEVSDGLLLAVVEDFDADRFLLVRTHGWVGSLTITRDGATLKPPFEELTIEQYDTLVDAAGRHEDHSRIVSDHLGIWIPLKRTETLKLVADLVSPEAARVNLAYNPQEGWSGSIEPSIENEE